MKKAKVLLVISLAVLVAVITGCRKNASLPVVEVAETPRPQPAQTWTAPDTTAFSAVDLEAEMARKIRENLQVLYFELDRYDLTQESLQKLQVAANFLRQYPQLRIRLDGHADERGTTEYNMALGEKRANAARDALIRLGTERQRMETTSFGRERPVNPNCGGNEACHGLNRRVEYTIIRN